MRNPLLLLIECQHLSNMLCETRIDFLRQRYMPLIDAAFVPKEAAMSSALSAQQHHRVAVHRKLAHMITHGTQKNVTAEEIFNWVLTLDPTSTKKYAQWALNGLLKGYWLPDEDAYKVAEYLERFDKLQPRLPQAQRDINRYHSLADLFTAIQPTHEQSQREIDRALDRQMHAEAKVLLDTPEYKIVTPLTRDASCYFGRNTQWCTAASKEGWNAFDQYHKQGPLYIVLDKKHNRRWQFHETTGQYMDETDKAINLQDFERLHPIVAKFFQERDGTALGKVLDGIAFAKPEGGFIIKSRRGLGGKTILDIRVNDKNELVTLGGDLNTPSLGPEFCAILNRLKITGGSRPSFLLFFGKGRWSNNIAAVGDKVIGNWYHVITSDQHPYYGLVEDGKRALNATVNQNQITFWTRTGRMIFREPPLQHKQEMARQHGKAAIDLVLQLGNIKAWSHESTFDTRHLSPEQVKRLVNARPDFELSMTAYLPIYGVTAELKQHLSNVLNARKWIGDRLLVEMQSNLRSYLSVAVGQKMLSQVHQQEDTIDLLYSEANRGFFSERLYQDGPQRILTQIPSKMRMQIGKKLKKFSAGLPHYDPLSAADICKVIWNAMNPDDDGDHRFRMPAQWFSALNQAVWVGAHRAFEMMVSEAVGRHCPDELFFEQKDGRFTKDVDLFAPVGLLVTAEKLVQVYDTTQGIGNNTMWNKVLNIRLDVSAALTNGIPPDEFDLTAATASFVAELPKLLGT